jgi:hypothetical protein
VRMRIRRSRSFLANVPVIDPVTQMKRVLDVCHEFQRFVGRSLLVTADYGMRLRARAELIDVLLLPKKYFKTTKNVENSEEEAP